MQILDFSLFTHTGGGEGLLERGQSKTDPEEETGKGMQAPKAERSQLKGWEETRKNKVHTRDIMKPTALYTNSRTQVTSQEHGSAGEGPCGTG